ncbi:MAG: diguanylate cyclase [Motiliproteus sp.]|nr:diguanylate cyclase [Motiliproteus sp.]
MGVYQNNPSVFYDDNGKVRGFYIEILEHIAKAEGWQLQYVKDTWPGLIKQLNTGSIDMIAGMAYNEERDKIYDFTSEPLFINWGQVYVRDKDIQSILDLRQRRVVGLKEDIYTLSFKSLLERFDLPVTFIEVDSYAQILRQVENGFADAGITSRSNGNTLAANHKVYRSPIVCCSKEVHYAVKEGMGGDYLEALNRQLRTLKDDNNSYYFKALDRWYGDQRELEIPEWLIWTLGGTLSVLAMLFGGVLVLRQQVSERTSKLQEAHDQLESRVAKRTAELYEKNQQLLNEINEHRKTQKKLQHMVRHDPLTGLPNRRWFSEHLQEDIKRAKRNQQQLAVMFLDLDGFKQTNDSFGHDCGDLVLIRAAERIRECLRETDKLVRLGGDEFIVIVPEIRCRRAVEVVAEKIIERFRDPFIYGGCDCPVGISMGISLFPDHGEEPEVLLNHADNAMYSSKKTGRNRFTVYGDLVEVCEETLVE